MTIYGVIHSCIFDHCEFECHAVRLPYTCDKGTGIEFYCEMIFIVKCSVV